MDRAQLYYVFGVVFFILVCITGAGVGCRLYLRVYLQGNILKPLQWSWSDRLLFLTWLGYFGCSIVNGVVRFSYGWIPDTIDDHAKEIHFADARRLLFAYVTMIWVFMFILKGSMLCFFDEFVHRESYYRTWIVIRVLGLLTVIGGTSSFIYSMLWCLPFHRNLDGINQGSCWFEYEKRLRYTTYRQIWHITLDLAILIVPVPLIPKLRHVSIRQFIGLAIVLTIGLFGVAYAIVFTFGILNWDNGPLQGPSAEWFLNYEPVVEMAVAILIQCVPAIRFLLRGESKPKNTKAAGKRLFGLGLNRREFLEEPPHVGRLGPNKRTHYGTSVRAAPSDTTLVAFDTWDGGAMKDIDNVQTRQIEHDVEQGVYLDVK